MCGVGMLVSGEGPMRSRRGRPSVWLPVVLLLLGLTWVRLPAQQPTYDVLIRGGGIVDGTGNPWFRADVAIDGDRIVAVGTLGDVRAARVIDATGLFVTPGFIDLHTHSDMPLLVDGTAQSKVRQGVTLDVIGKSTSVAPRDGLGTTSKRGGRADWTTFTDYFERLDRQGISMNLISHVSATQARRVVMGYDSRSRLGRRASQFSGNMRRRSAVSSTRSPNDRAERRFVWASVPTSRSVFSARSPTTPGSTVAMWRASRWAPGTSH